MNTAALAEQRAGSNGLFVAVAIAGLLGAGASVWHQLGANAELNTMPTKERVPLYGRTLVTLRTNCVHATGPRLHGYCQEQAEFLSRFPECEAACQRTCQRYALRPTK